MKKIDTTECMTDLVDDSAEAITAFFPLRKERTRIDSEKLHEHETFLSKSQEQAV